MLPKNTNEREGKRRRGKERGRKSSRKVKQPIKYHRDTKEWLITLPSKRLRAIWAHVMYLSVGAGPFRDMIKGVRAWGTWGYVRWGKIRWGEVRWGKESLGVVEWGRWDGYGNKKGGREGRKANDGGRNQNRTKEDRKIIEESKNQ